MCGSDGAPPLSAALPLSLALCAEKFTLGQFDSTEAFLLPAVRVFELRTLRFSRPSSRDCRNRSAGTGVYLRVDSSRLAVPFGGCYDSPLPPGGTRWDFMLAGCLQVAGVYNPHE